MSIRELTARHDVFIVTAAMDVPCSFDAKYRWLRQHFPFIPSSNIVFCGDKGVIDADYLIDDRARHFLSFKDAGCCSRRRTMRTRRGIPGCPHGGRWAISSPAWTPMISCGLLLQDPGAIS